MNIVTGRRVYVQEVAPRDGFQIEPTFIPTERKIALIDELASTGIPVIEATSFTSPKAIPAVRDAEDVMRGITRAPGVTYAALVPNLRGAERALAARVDEINLVMSVSETHNLANLRMTREQSYGQLCEVIRAMGGQVFINVSLATSFGCPMEGAVPEAEVWRWSERLLEAGAAGITIADTTGMAHPGQVGRMTEAFRRRWPEVLATPQAHMLPGERRTRPGETEVGVRGEKPDVEEQAMSAEARGVAGDGRMGDAEMAGGLSQARAFGKPGGDGMKQIAPAQPVGGREGTRGEPAATSAAPEDGEAAAVGLAGERTLAAIAPAVGGRVIRAVGIRAIRRSEAATTTPGGLTSWTHSAHMK